MESTILSNSVTSVVNLMTTGREKEEKDVSKYVFMDQVKTFTTFKIATFLANYWFPILVPVGFVGNTVLCCYDKSE